MGRLGTNKDLEKLARQVRRAGGSVEVTRRGRLLWRLPDGQVIRTGGGSMKDSRAQAAHRQIRAALELGSAESRIRRKAP